MKTREDTIATLRQLLLELEEKPETWENPTLESYLEAMAAWLEDSGHKLDSPHLGN